MECRLPSDHRSRKHIRLDSRDQDGISGSPVSGGGSCPVKGVFGAKVLLNLTNKSPDLNMLIAGYRLHLTFVAPFLSNKSGKDIFSS